MSSVMMRELSFGSNLTVEGRDFFRDTDMTKAGLERKFKQHPVSPYIDFKIREFATISIKLEYNL